MQLWRKIFTFGSTVHGVFCHGHLSLLPHIGWLEQSAMTLHQKLDSTLVVCCRTVSNVVGTAFVCSDTIFFFPNVAMCIDIDTSSRNVPGKDFNVLDWGFHGQDISGSDILIVTGDAHNQFPAVTFATATGMHTISSRMHDTAGVLSTVKFLCPFWRDFDQKICCSGQNSGIPGSWRPWHLRQTS